MKSITHRDYRSIIKYWLSISFLFFYTSAVYADGSLYTLTKQTTLNGSTAYSIQISTPSSFAAQNKGEQYTVSLPSGDNVLGAKTLTIPNVAKKGLGNTSIIALEDGKGSVEIIENKQGQITQLQLFDSTNQTLYRAKLDSLGAGELVQADIEAYQCLDMPIHNPSGTELEPEINEELIPDLSTLQSLQSRPGATKVLYLNFWGGTLTGTAWNNNFNSGNPIVYTPFSIDGNTATFSSADRHGMWLGWRETAEDYAAFDVNVTSSAAVYNATAISNRVQIIATTTKSWYGNAGGVAYVGIFNHSTDYYKTGWAWNKGNGSFGMTVSHEAGHQVGLLHDGTSATSYYHGHGDWGPIMGAPFNKKYVQWSKGEYANANQTQDDISIANSVIGSIVDDAGNNTATATALSLPVNNQEGLITHNAGIATDVDYYSFSASGQTDIKIAPILGDENETMGTNLSMKARVLDSSGAEIASIMPTYLPSSNILNYSGSLNAGTYYLVVEALSPDPSWTTGFGEYSNGGLYRMSLSTEAIASDPEITSPASGSTLTGSSASFSWIDNGSSVSEWWLYVGSSIGVPNYYDSGSLGTTTSDTVTGLPTDGSTIHVRLWYKEGGTWKSVDSSYTADNSGSTLPAISSPVEGSTLTSTTQVFSWGNNGTSVTEWWIYAGSSIGADHYYNSGSLGTATNDTITGLPADGSTIYIRLWYKEGGVWKSVDTTYIADNSGSSLPAISSPVAGSTLTGATQVFAWENNGTSVTQWWVYAGSSTGASDYYDSGSLGTATNNTVTGLPVDESTVYIRLWYKEGGVWNFVDTTYTSSGS